MARYRNLNRGGTRSTTNINPKLITEDISESIRNLAPEATPLQAFSTFVGMGSAPKSKKVQSIQYYEFDPIDYASKVDMGKSELTHFAKVALNQASRPDVNNRMYYSPQDKFFIIPTGQTVEVVMTPDDSIKMNQSGSSRLELRADFVNGGAAGDKAAFTNPGEVIFRNVEDAPLLPFTSGDVVHMGRTIHESQKIEASPAMRDVLFDCNFVEHKEKVIAMTEDQKNMIQNIGKFRDWDFQQEHMVKEFKREVENTLFFGERSIDFRIPDRPTYHMRGLFHAIQTNVAYYNPHSITDFEKMFNDFLFQMAFQHNPNGTTKIGLCGPAFLQHFNMAFREYRRTSDIDVKTKSVGLNINAYELPGGFRVNLMRSDLLRQGTQMEDWCFIIDPKEAEMKLSKNYTTKHYELADERDMKLMIEWQGTVAWNREQCHALLRTAVR